MRADAVVAGKGGCRSKARSVQAGAVLRAGAGWGKARCFRSAHSPRRARSCDAVKSNSGPRGTMPVGLMSSCVA